MARRHLQGEPAIPSPRPGQKIAGYKDSHTRAFYVLADGVTPGEVDIGRFRYAEYANASYQKFKALKKGGTIPAATRFQVSLPTAVAATSAFIEIDARADVEPAAENALMGEVADLGAAIPAPELAIQWDVCMENLATSVAFANAIIAGSPRPVQWMHMPVPRGRSDDAYFKPLKDLRFGSDAELYLGLLHYTDGLGGTKRRIATAEKYAADFGIATECGFGRRPADTIPALLDLHAQVADES